MAAAQIRSGEAVVADLEGLGELVARPGGARGEVGEDPDPDGADARGRHGVYVRGQGVERGGEVGLGAEDAAGGNLTGGTVVLGTFSSAHYLLHADLVANFRALHPQVRVRLAGMNSVQVADGVRNGDLDAGLVALPVDDRSGSCRRRAAMMTTSHPHRLWRPPRRRSASRFVCRARPAGAASFRPGPSLPVRRIRRRRLRRLPLRPSPGSS
ncbi:LysR family transcriptional regulator substrate-binding protein [Streptomyces sp. NBC_01236]|uniref:LysR family transcriptional regulator substrate-binding protein n=1 Tax=Streptomyces sp. NBC_01236 TaxID=2903789 RepID=UPI003FA382C1